MPIVSDGDTLFASDLAITSRNWGVLSGMSVSASGGMYVNVASGVAMMGTPYYVLENRSIQLPSGLSNDRLDLVQFSPASGNFYYRMGTAANPAALPTIGNFEINLASVSVPANTLTTSTITDKRHKIALDYRRYSSVLAANMNGIVVTNNQGTDFAMSPSGLLNLNVGQGIVTTTGPSGYVGYAQLIPSKNFQLSTADATFPRKDLLFVEGRQPSLESGFIGRQFMTPSGGIYSMTELLLAGKAETEPLAPLPYSPYIVPLGVIDVSPNMTSLTQQNIQDIRSLISSLGTSVFGNGADGDVTVSGTTTLTTDMFYNSLTVSAGGTLNTGGYRIFVKTTLTLNGTIANKGGNASGSTHGTGGATGTIGGGANGGDGGTSVGNVGSNGDIGGAGGASDVAGGTAATSGTKLALTTPYLLGGLGTSVLGGGGGAGSKNSGGGTGGGGGGGGGIVLVVAKNITGNGSITATGGNGSDNSGNGPGGGGGGGVVVVLFYSLVNGITFNVQGGGFSGAGNPGAAGRVLKWNASWN